jgi:hypothetical protein
MTATLQVPLLFSALFFAGLAIFEWRRAPVWARIHLGVATAFALAALGNPWMSIQDTLEGSRDGMTYVVALARAAGLVAALVTVSTRVREYALGDR